MNYSTLITDEFERVMVAMRAALEGIKNYFLRAGERIVAGAYSKMTEQVKFAFGSIFDMLKPFVGRITLVGNIVRLIDSFLGLTSQFLERGFLITSGGISSFLGVNFYVKLVSFIMNCYDAICAFNAEFKIDINLVDPVPVLEGQAQAGSFETMGAALFMSAFLPKQFAGIIRDFSIFTHTKILDDTTWVYELVSFILSLPTRILTVILPESEFKDGVINFFTYFTLSTPFSKFAVCLREFEPMYLEYSRRPAVAGEAPFQARFHDFYLRYIPIRDELLGFKHQLPTYGVVADKRIFNMSAKIKYIQNNVRQEPVCFVFVGPKGSGKSTLMNQFQQALGKNNSIYVHAVPGEKDFYDRYDDEDIFIMDDVGQKGVYQWSNLINMVSATKFPLDCAEATLKGTKFFNSKVIMTTTNSINLTLTADCGIADLAALHRRLRVFDFAKVTFENGIYQGDLEYKEYNLNRNVFVTQQVFRAVNGIFNRRAIGDLMFEKIQQQVNIFRDFQAGNAGFELDAIPQGKFLSDLIALLKTRSTMMAEFMYEYFSPYNIAHFVRDHKYQMMIMFSGMLCGALYYMFHDNLPKDEKTVNNVLKTYNSGKVKKTKLLDAVPQGIEDLFKMTANFVDVLPLQRLRDQTYVLEASYLQDGVQVRSMCTCVLAGRFFTAPLHGLTLAVGDFAHVTIYSHEKSRYYDNVKAECVYVHKNDDVVLMQLPFALPKYTKNLNFCPNTNNTSLILSTPVGLVKLADHLRKLDCNMRYKSLLTNYTNTIPPDGGMLYDLNRDTLCGSMLVTEDGFLLGHHVAVVNYPLDSGVSKDLGVARIFSKETRDAIITAFSQQIRYYVQPTREQPHGSVVRVVSDGKFSPQFDQSTLVPSVVSGVFPQTRAPAQLQVYGTKTAEIMDAASHAPCDVVDEKALKYAQIYLTQLLPTFRNQLLTEGEIINGFGYLGPIDKDTSVGFGLHGDKLEYLDYDKGCYTPVFKKMVDEVEQSMLDGSFRYDTYFAVQLKDELRDLAKTEKPRVFKMSPLVLTVLFRKYFGVFLSEIRRERRLNGIQIGINPLGPDWHELRNDTLRFGDNVFDGDYAGWDKKMLSQLQQAVADVTLMKCSYTTPDRIDAGIPGITATTLPTSAIVPSVLLQVMCTTPTIVGGKLTITTHSLPSGLSGTAEFNSLVNKCYGAYVFYTVCVEYEGKIPSIATYMNNVVDNVYGDDKLVAVSDRYKDIFNGATYQVVMKSIGLDFTPADKGLWTYKTRTIDECSFLKRGFRFHPEIGQYVAPLDPISMCGTLNYVKDDFRNEELTRIKVLNFQREAYLHEKYAYYMAIVEKYIRDSGFIVNFFKPTYLQRLYGTADYSEFLQLS